jgi:hypothetical protein
MSRRLQLRGHSVLPSITTAQLEHALSRSVDEQLQLFTKGPEVWSLQADLELVDLLPNVTIGPQSQGRCLN